MTNLTVTVKTVKSVEDTIEKSPCNLWGDENFLQKKIHELYEEENQLLGFIVNCDKLLHMAQLLWEKVVHFLKKLNIHLPHHL